MGAQGQNTTIGGPVVRVPFNALCDSAPRRSSSADGLQLHDLPPLVEQHPAVFPDPSFPVQLQQLSYPGAEYIELLLAPWNIGRPQQLTYLFQ
jgi:hypothetical protein